MKRQISILAIGLIVVVAMSAVYIMGWVNGKSGQELTMTKKSYAAGDASATSKSSRATLTDPNGTVANPYNYYPGTEKLGPDEIRVVALGTGMPAARRGQAAACFLVELGNGDKFLFDMGLGSMGNLFSLRPDFAKLDKVFVKDHFPSPYYISRRRNTFIIGVDHEPCDGGFCRALGTDTVSHGFGLYLTDLGDRYFVAIDSDRGYRFLHEVECREVDAGGRPVGGQGQLSNPTVAP